MIKLDQTPLWVLPTVLLFIPGCLAAEFGDDFANNLFTDLAPLIALFGERVTMQYMSQATGWADSFTLAMAPLGILTIVVSAIRVGGPSWLKAIIGRARENLAAAEVELMSSTSVDVCELWNGSEIVRSLGSPPVREFIILIPKGPKNVSRRIESFDFECQNIEKAKIDGYLTTCVESGDSEKGMSGSMPSGSRFHTVVSADVEETELQDLSRPKLVIIYNESKSAPNVSLNVHPQKRGEVRAAAVLGTILQMGVLIYAGFATYYHTMRFPKEENRPVSDYAFPCTCCGTIVLVIGLLLCADVVEKRTEETARKPRSGYEAYAIWVQRQATVGDQVFRSFGIFSGKPREEVFTSRRDDMSEKTAVPVDVPFVDRVVQVICYLPFKIYQLLNISQLLENPMAPLFTKRSVQFSKTTVGAFLSISGYVVQFVGLRDMHWSVAIVQLGAVAFMTAMRAVIRRGLAEPPRAQSLSQDFELEWLASTLVGIEGPNWKPPMTDHVFWPGWIVLGDEGVQLEPPNDLRDDSGMGSQRHQAGSQDGVAKNDSEDDDSEDDDSEDDDSEDDDVEDYHRSEDTNSGGRQDNCQDNCQNGSERDERHESKTRSETNSDSWSSSNDALQADNDIDTATYPRSGRASVRNDDRQAKTLNSEAQTVMMLRSSFGSFTGWHSPVFTEADYLCRAIEVVMNTLFSTGEFEHFNWPLQATYGISGPQLINVSISLVKGNWQISRYDVEAILSLWFFSFTRDFPRDSNDNEEASTISTGQGVILLGTDTPQLRRDLRWWVPQDLKRTIVVRQSPQGSLVVKGALVVGCGRATPHEVKLERTQLDENDNKPPYGQTVENGFLAVESFRAPASLFALDLFSSFMKEVARTMDKPVHGQGETRPIDSRSSWTSFTLHNTLLSKMAGDIQNTGLATLSEAYSTIIPSLSIENKLPPVDNIIELARDHAKPHEERGDMKKVTEIYMWLIKTTQLFPHNTSFVAKSTVVILDHLNQLAQSIELSDRLKSIALQRRFLERLVKSPVEAPSSQQIESELQLGQPRNRSLLIRLMALYDDQNRADIIPSQILNLVEDYPVFLQQKRTYHHNLEEEYEDGIEQRDITGWTSLHRVAAEGYTLPLANLLNNDIDPDTQDLLGQTALHLACQTGKIQSASILARSGADINAKARDGSTALHYAAKKGHLSIVKLLVESGAEFNTMDSSRMTPAMWAALEGKNDVLAYLWENSNLNLRDRGGRAILHLAVLSGRPGMVGVFGKGVDTEVRDHDGRTPLHLAALHGNEDALSKLKSHFQADLDALDENGNQLLHLAAAGGQSGILRQLVRDLDKDINCINEDCETPLHLAVLGSKDQAIEVLIELGANLEARRERGETPLMVACMLGRIKIARHLVALGAKVNTVTNFHSSTLYQASWFGQIKVVKYLLQQGVDKDTQDQDGWTALHGAAWLNHTEIARLLLAAGADKEKSDESGMTPLHLAAQAGNSAVAKALVMKGANKEAKDKNGKTPLQLAASGTMAHYMGGRRAGNSVL